MVKQVKAEAGVLDAAVTTVDDYRANQNTIAMRVKSTASECRASQARQGTVAITQVIMQFMEEYHRVDQALLKLSNNLRGTGTVLTNADLEVVIGTRHLGSEAASSYRNLPWRPHCP